MELATKLGLDVQKTEEMKGSGESEDDRRRVAAETWLAAVAGDRSSTPLDDLRSLLAEMDLDVRLFERKVAMMISCGICIASDFCTSNIL